MTVLLAIDWENWLRGVLTVIIAVGTLCGSVYLILGTNMGARLGFLVSLAALSGWIFIMGAIWWSYGQGLKGDEPSWQAVGGRTVIRQPDALHEVGIITVDVEQTDKPAEDSSTVETQLQEDGWTKLDSALPQYQQAGSAATVFVEESGAFDAGEFQVDAVFIEGGEKYPAFWDEKIDFLAFWHHPQYSVVEIVPLVEQRTEPGRAPARPIVDTERSHEYVYMVRDLGNKRVPSAIVCISGLTIFLISCWLLHRRDRYVRVNRAAKALPAA